MELIKNLATCIGVIAALWGLYKGFREFALQGTQKRADMFLKKQGEYFANPSFNKLRGLIDSNDVALISIEFEEKRAYLTFFEEIAVLKNSGLISADLAYYMFGYYATKCLESENFWADMNKQDIFWTVFLRFATEMQGRLRGEGEVVSHAIRF
ncbi:high-affinity Fe2+/Pb2+ permease [Pseudomonas sp. TE3786]